jgi:hypothetical protein
VPLFWAQRLPEYHHRRAARLLAAGARGQGAMGGLKPIRDHQRVRKRPLVLLRHFSATGVASSGRSSGLR